MTDWKHSVATRNLESEIEEAERAWRERVQEAMWNGDTALLHEIAGCGCCCDEHTDEGCPARLWGACRGQDSLTRADLEGWIQHYEKTRGMTRDEFWNVS